MNAMHAVCQTCGTPQSVEKFMDDVPGSIVFRYCNSCGMLRNFKVEVKS